MCPLCKLPFLIGQTVVNDPEEGVPVHYACLTSIQEQMEALEADEQERQYKEREANQELLDEPTDLE